MGYVSKYNRTFISYINKKYKRHKVDFKYWDDYVIWLYYKLCHCDNILYYQILEKDIWEYSDWQTGSPRENEKNDENWKDMEKDRYGLYQNENYVEYLKRNEWNKWKKIDKF